VTGEVTAYLGLGSNLGDRVANLAAALDALEASGLAVEAVSSVYDTPPWGEPPPGLAEPPRYANAAAAVRTALAPLDLLRLCKRIEVDAGRDLHAPRNAPRVLDLDVLLVGDLEMATPELEAPHPRMHLRAFVLVPLAEIAPDARHPRLDRPVRDLLADVDAAEVAEVELLLEPGWWR
jgi:2-amino-4-hydroxy-6-hydroxymethyldihydropteridine diphosphokinase